MQRADAFGDVALQLENTLSAVALVRRDGAS